MIGDDDLELDEPLRIACSQVVVDATSFATVLSSRHRSRKRQEPYLKVKVPRKIYGRPSYKCSTWWTMLQKGDCKIEGHPQNKVFRRRFAVPFTMFRTIVTEAREWIVDGDKKMGDTTTDCVGVV